MVGAPSDLKPLILDSANRLYLRRYWEYEQSLAKAIRDRWKIAPPKVDPERLMKGLDRLFPDKDPANRQRVAAHTAATQEFLCYYWRPRHREDALRCWPSLPCFSNKPANRSGSSSPRRVEKQRSVCRESVQRGKEGLDCPAQIKEWMPNEAATIHRLLRAIPESPYFRHNAEHQLLVDAVIVDEASMIDSRDNGETACGDSIDSPDDPPWG